MSDSSRPHGLQPTRLLRPWDFPGKSTGVGCHCLLRACQPSLLSKSLLFNKAVSYPSLFVVQSLSPVYSLRPHGLQHAWLPCPSPSPRNLLKLMSPESVMPSNHLLLCHPLLLLSSIFPSIRVFSNESALHIRWPKYQDQSFQ